MVITANHYRQFLFEFKGRLLQNVKHGQKLFQ